ncbi:hypothetical protein [Nonlabens marinus]|uniref:Uncharacterized protein n=1 Tax=Nonlabens marinus S1-08 TaxID=1454201 RepID=W8VNU0_9FLAO|nr:hypothetical protein [Nonlabens marinus]BAO54070.1 hypothetical protein NMS_0061 [Nonlabens marinus S1-08]
MTEPKIRDYFLGLIPAKELVKVDKAKSAKIIAYWKEVEMIQEGEFIIKPKNLLTVCDDVLNGSLKLQHLMTISLVAIGSDYFDWDMEDKEGQKVCEVLDEWCNPTINYPLTLPNVVQWKNYLITGEREMNL